MITEKDVEKLDSIQPSEIEKLSRIQDSKDSNTGNVLTVVSGGKAEYRKPASGGTQIRHSTTSVNGNIQQSPTYGYYVEKQDIYSPEIISCNFHNFQLKSGETVIPYSDVILMAIAYSTYTSILILIPETTMTKYNLTVGSPITSNVGYYYNYKS